MITKIYRVKGTFVMGDEYHEFVKEYKATSESDIEQKSMTVSEVNMVLTGIKFLLLKSKKLLLKMLLTQS